MVDGTAKVPVLYLHRQSLANDVERVLLRGHDQQHADAETDECVREVGRLVLHLDRVHHWPWEATRKTQRGKNRKKKSNE